MHIVTYTAKYRNPTSKTGETDIRLYAPDGSFTAKFIKEYSDRRVDSSQFKKSEKGMDAAILSDARFSELKSKLENTGSAEESSLKDKVSRNALKLRINFQNYELGPYEIVLIGKRGDQLGKCFDQRSARWIFENALRAEDESSEQVPVCFEEFYVLTRTPELHKAGVFGIPRET